MIDSRVCNTIDRFSWRAWRLGATKRFSAGGSQDHDRAKTQRRGGLHRNSGGFKISSCRDGISWCLGARKGTLVEVYPGSVLDQDKHRILVNPEIGFFALFAAWRKKRGFRLEVVKTMLAQRRKDAEDCTGLGVGSGCYNAIDRSSWRAWRLGARKRFAGWR